MLKKTRSLILTFSKTVDAMAAESYLTGHGLPGRMIPVPREITAGCGLAWKAPPEAEAAICAALEAGKIAHSGVYVLEV